MIPTGSSLTLSDRSVTSRGNSMATRPPPREDRKEPAMASAAAARPKAAERIQTAAKGLFYRQGIRATGVEEVCRAAEATKMSLYRSYPSKDALVAAILEEDAARYDAWF